MIEDSYIGYKNRLGNEYQPLLQYRGEYLAKMVFPHIADSDGCWLVWDNEYGLECCKIKKQLQGAAIVNVVNVPHFSSVNESFEAIFTQDASLLWLNLCYFKDKDGAVHYDGYYDRYPAGEFAGTEVPTIGEMRSILNDYIAKYLPFEQGDKIVVDGRLKEYNFIFALLQNNGFEPIMADGNDEECKYKPETNGKMRLYTVGADSTIIVPMPFDKDIMVYDEVTGDRTGEVARKQQLHCAKGDMLGNIWLRIENVDGSVTCSHHTESGIIYSEITE